MSDETANEYMDTGALTEDAVPAEETAPEEPVSVPEPYQEAPGSPSSESVENASPEDSDGSTGADADLPHGAKITSPEEAEQNTVAGNPPGDPTL